TQVISPTVQPDRRPAQSDTTPHHLGTPDSPCAAKCQLTELEDGPKQKCSCYER
ncbi:hypothetical protein NDU88_003495, partial [Pleurodeles waltl]